MFNSNIVNMMAHAALMNSHAAQMRRAHSRGMDQARLSRDMAKKQKRANLISYGGEEEEEEDEYDGE